MAVVRNVTPGPNLNSCQHQAAVLFALSLPFQQRLEGKVVKLQTSAFLLATAKENNTFRLDKGLF